MFYPSSQPLNMYKPDGTVIHQFFVRCFPLVHFPLYFCSQLTPWHDILQLGLQVPPEIVLVADSLWMQVLVFWRKSSWSDRKCRIGRRNSCGYSCSCSYNRKIHWIRRSESNQRSGRRNISNFTCSRRNQSIPYFCHASKLSLRLHSVNKEDIRTEV